MQVAIDFVGGDVVEAEGGFLRVVQAAPIGAGGFEQGEGADDIGVDKFACAVDAAVNMAFGGQVHHGAGLVFGEDALERGAVADIGLLEGVARVAGHGGKRLQVAGVGEFVEINDALVGVLDQVADKGGADKAGTAGDEKGHGDFLCFRVDGLSDGLAVVCVVDGVFARAGFGLFAVAEFQAAKEHEGAFVAVFDAFEQQVFAAFIPRDTLVFFGGGLL